MDPDAELDLPLGQVEDGLSVGGWNARRQRYPERARARVHTLDRVGDMGQVGPSLGRRAGKLFCQHRGAYAPAARRVERVLDGDVIVDDD